MQGPHSSQSETSCTSAPGSAGGLRSQVRQAPWQSQGLSRRPFRSRSGFTLTELLIVIAIIGVLAALITVAAKGALQNANRARVLLEIKNISASLENFKNEYSAYPPNGMNLMSAAPPTLKQAANDFAKVMKQAYPSMKKDEERLIRAIAGQTPAASPLGASTTFEIVTGPLTNGLAANEALYFWLGGFSDDQQFPLSGAGGPSFVDTDTDGDEVLESRKRRYEFDLTRLSPRNDQGAFDETKDAGNGMRILAYKIDLDGDGNMTDANETRQINFWQYLPSGSEQPLVYFDVSRYSPAKYDPSAAPGVADNIFALKKRREGKATPTSLNDFVFVQKGKFQILHCGLDGVWGEFGTSVSSATNVNDVTLIFPDGPFIGDVADTLTNFADGTLEKAAEQ